MRAFSELVSTFPDSMKNVNYGGFVAPPIEAIKELKAEDAALEYRLATREKKLGL